MSSDRKAMCLVANLLNQFNELDEGVKNESVSDAVVKFIFFTNKIEFEGASSIADTKKYVSIFESKTFDNMKVPNGMKTFVAMISPFPVGNISFPLLFLTDKKKNVELWPRPISREQRTRGTSKKALFEDETVVFE